MLFNSAQFILILLPIAFAGFAVLGSRGWSDAAKLWLVLVSLVFYSWWRPENLPLLVGSMAVNFAIGTKLASQPSKPLLAAGIVLNCLFLGYFKYAVFLVETAGSLSGASWTVPRMILPLGISFFTFQQIGYLIDAHGGRAKGRRALDYAAFVSFFPQLISGPITHYREMIPQFNDPERFRPRWDFIGTGLTVFAIGLFKKVLVADPFGATVNPIFERAQAGGVGFLEAWTAALSYSLQMYFDFSGYCDMAIGLGLLFGIALPLNFNSPYKARNMIEFWARWHMTLTRFLTAYIYNPVTMAISRRRAQRGLPLPRRGRMSVGTFLLLVAWPTMLTMFVSGVWHGAGWQFIIFGLLHGLFLVVAHGWHAWKAHKGITGSGGPLAVAASVLLTFLCATVALVFFRAPSVSAALDILGGMAGLNGVVLPSQVQGLPLLARILEPFGVTFGTLDGASLEQFVRIAIFLGAVWLLPNTYEWLRNYPTAVDFKPPSALNPRSLPVPAWRPSGALGATIGALFLFSLLVSFSAAQTEFIYFQF